MIYQTEPGKGGLTKQLTQRNIRHHHDNETDHQAERGAGDFAGILNFRSNFITNDMQHGADSKTGKKTGQKNRHIDDLRIGSDNVPDNW